MPITNRYFGVEIEFNGIDEETVLAALRSADVNVEQGWGTPSTYWRLKYDCSVNTTGLGRYVDGGHEMVSPKLRGEEGLEEVRKVCRALSAAGARVDRSCGVHVHVDALGLSASEIANVALRYAHFEGEIDAFMPASRRGNSNNYSGSVAAYLNGTDYGFRSDRRRRLLSARSPRGVANTMNERYLKLNLQSYIVHGSIEFRQHSGSTNATKICNWIQFCVNFVEASRNQAATSESTINVSSSVPLDTSSLNARQALLIEHLRHGAATITALAYATGYTESSIPVIISNLRQLGYEIRRNRRQRTYELVSAPAATATRSSRRRPRTSNARQPSAPDFTNDTVYRGLDPDLVSYFTERAQDLAA